MPGVDGLSALPRLRAAAPDCEVVVLTASGTEENLLAAIRGGAAGYLLKSEPPERIVAFLRGVANGEAALSGEVARRLLDQVRAGGRLGGGVPDRIAQRLSAREVEVLLLLDDHLSTDDIAKRLFISEHTVRSHVKSLLRKLGVSSRREALEQLSRRPPLTQLPRGMRFTCRGDETPRVPILEPSDFLSGGEFSGRTVGESRPFCSGEKPACARRRAAAAWRGCSRLRARRRGAARARRSARRARGSSPR